MTDPTTQYPVIIDPDVQFMTANSDTWVMQDSGQHGGDYDLRVGKQVSTGNTNPAISYVKWNLVDRIPAGSTIVSAQVGLWQFWAGSCGASGATNVVVQPLSSNWAPSITYPTRPGSLSQDYGYITDNRGSQCGNSGRVEVSATTWVTKWWTGVYPNYGLRFGVPAANETQTSWGRRFCSYKSGLNSNCPNAAYEPYLRVTYNKAPNTPYDISVTNGGNPVTVYGTVTDPNAESNLRVYVAVKKKATSDLVWGNYVQVSGTGSSQVSARLPYLPDGEYTVETQAVDDSNATSAASSPRTFTVETEFGTQPWFSTTQHSLNSRSAIQVNNRTGNLVFQANDISVNGLGLDLNGTRFYNSQSVQTNAQSVITASDRWYTSLGSGWSLSMGPDVWMQKRGSNFHYHAPGGTVFGPFTPDGATKYQSPKGGVGADLSKDGSTYTLKFRKSQLRYEFREFGTEGHLYQTKIRDKSGNEINFAYATSTTPNGRAKLTTITDASSRVYSVTYTGNYIANIVNTSDQPGSAAQKWVYTQSGDRLVANTSPDGKVTQYEYTQSATTGAYLLSKITAPINQSGMRPTTSFVYFGNTADADRIDKVSYQTSSSDANTFGWVYKRRATDGSCNSGADYSTTVTDARSKDTAYCFHNSNATDTGGKVRVYDALGNIKTTTYTADKGIATVTTPSNQAAGGSTMANYPGTGFTDRLNSVTEPKNTNDGSTKDSVTQFNYGTSPAAGTEYLPRSVAGADGKCAAYEYDSSGRTTAAYTGISYAEATTTCDKGNKIGSHRRYNGNGTMSQSWDANAYGAGENDNDELGADRKTIYTYWSSSDAGYVANTSGQLRTVRKPGGSCAAPRKLCTTFTYDLRARVTSVTDGRGKVTTYSYDALDRTTGVYFNGATTCATDNSNCVRYAYDGEGNLVSREEKTGATAFTYDRLNRQTSESHTPLAGLDPESPSYGYSDYNITMVYDRNGNLTTLQQAFAPEEFPDPEYAPVYEAHSVTYQYDSANRLSKVGTEIGEITVSSDQDGRVKQIAYPGSTGVLMNYNYTKFGKPKSADVKAKTSGDLKREFNYDYKIDIGTFKVVTDQLRNRQVNLPGTSNDEDIDYTYDADSHIAGAANDNGPDFYYTHDKIGNVTSEDSAGTMTYFGYDRAGQLCWRGQTDGDKLNQDCSSGPSGSTNFTHDAAGNNTNTSSNPTAYNDDSQVATINGVTMGYQDRGNTLRTSAGTTTYVNSALGVISKRTGNDTTYYVRDPQGSILASYGAGGTLYYFSEFNGSTAALYNPAGDEVGTYTYSPYGKTTVAGTSGSSNPFRYIGGLQDVDSSSNGTSYKLGARYYDAQGHFSQPDPIFPGGGSYTYAEGDPVNGSDPSGLITFEFGGKACFGVCVGLSVSADDEGNTGITPSLGFGTPGADAGPSVRSGTVSSGSSVVTSCSLGPVSASYDFVSESGGIGAQPKLSSGNCSLDVGRTFTF